jgi:transposase
MWPENPSYKKAIELTRDDRIRVDTLHNEGLTYAQISQRLSFTQRQVQYAVKHPLTPKKRKGRPSILTQEEIDEIITWVCFSKTNRRASWMKIPTYLNLNVSYHCV